MSDERCFLFINGEYAKEIEEWPEKFGDLVNVNLHPWHDPECKPVVWIGPMPEPPLPHSCEIDVNLLDGDLRSIYDISYRLGDEPGTAVELLGLGECSVRQIVIEHAPVFAGDELAPRREKHTADFSFRQYRQSGGGADE